MRVKTRQFAIYVRFACLRIVLAACALLCFGDLLNAQSADAKEGEKGFVWMETFQGTANTLGTVMKLDSSTGYQFDPHFEIGVGVPFYFVHASSTATAAGLGSVNGIGDPHLDLQFSFGNDSTRFVSTVTGTAPIADRTKGLSTGRATVDWTNYLEFTAGRISPFVSAGLANSISDTRFFTRPFTSLGVVANFEGGTYFDLSPAVSLGASVYADAPFGQQKVFSKLIKRGQPAAPGRGNGLEKKPEAFETESVTVGDASIARDKGGSAWLDLYPARFAGFQVGFSRSAEYDLNSVFFAIVLDVGRLVKARR